MNSDSRKYFDPEIGLTKMPIYWKDGKPTFVPPHLHEQALEEGLRFMSRTNPGRLEVIT